ncbi:Calcium/calmodulin dependent protein kinase II Association [Roseovarius albus]|uniref:Calcium/calmodulin dependent protein kinase II Association n=1 Tax=Roseovarius albus TaxID=1247867 RepID=A0A1X7A7N6_9RHOB|nr:nuclear transport factor 2 family protein [Roseovarius albus]SLN72571.1 Calcium/calmodulin dependent protein kinase II Association [Roseovarius albus]
MSRLSSSCLVALGFLFLFSIIPIRDAPAQAANDIADVQAASHAFYEALASESIGDAMAGVWAHKPYVTNVGPRSKSVVVGWDAVSQYWIETEKKVASVNMAIEAPHLHVIGDFAWEIGEEIGEVTMQDGTVRQAELLATNVFERIDGQWLMVSHHASRKPEQ